MNIRDVDERAQLPGGRGRLATCCAATENEDLGGFTGPTDGDGRGEAAAEGIRGGQHRLVADDLVLGGEGVHRLRMDECARDQVNTDRGETLVGPSADWQGNLQRLQETDQRLSGAKSVC
jgi:hypothetical protein